MEVRAHKSQHEVAEELPLITDSASVTTVDSMDDNRYNEAVEEVRRSVERHGKGSWLDADGDDVDWERLRTRMDESDIDVETAEKIAALVDRCQRAYPSLLRLRFRTDEDFDFVPGQYVTVRYRGTPRPYSVANSPNEDETEICVRRVPQGKLSTRLSNELSAGEEITARGPNGDFVLADVSEKDVVFLATGTGVAPFKSMIDYTFEEGRDVFDGEERDVWLFLGAGWKDDLPYRGAFRRLADERENFHFVPTLSRESYLTDWGGETEYVQRTFLKYLDEQAVADTDLGVNMRKYATADPRYDVDRRLDPGNVEVYACGINAMVYSLIDAVKRVGVPEADIRSEGYG